MAVNNGAKNGAKTATQTLAISDNFWIASLHALRRDVASMIGLAGLLLILLLTLLAPLLAPHDPLYQNYRARYEPPGSAAHLFGTDDLGRDVLSRVLWGGRESLGVAALAIAIAMSGGVVVGLISGYYGGWRDVVIQRITEVWLAFPGIIFLIVLVSVLGSGLEKVMIAVGLTLIPGYGRLVRGAVLAARAQDYVLAARALGARDARIMFNHILPNIIPPVIVFATLGLGSAILIVGGLSFIGLGVNPPAPEWGAMLLYARDKLRQAPWLSFYPGAAIFVTVLSVNLLGDGLRDALDPKLR